MKKAVPVGGIALCRSNYIEFGGIRICLFFPVFCYAFINYPFGKP